MQTGTGVVVGEKVGDAAIPGAAQAQADARVGEDVSDVVRAQAELRDHPEVITPAAAADRGAAREARPAAGRFQDGLSRHPRQQGVAQVSLAGGDDPALPGSCHATF